MQALAGAIRSVAVKCARTFAAPASKKGNVGIHAMDVYFPSTYVSQTALGLFCGK